MRLRIQFEFEYSQISEARKIGDVLHNQNSSACLLPTSKHDAPTVDT